MVRRHVMTWALAVTMKAGLEVFLVYCCPDRGSISNQYGFWFSGREIALLSGVATTNKRIE